MDSRTFAQHRVPRFSLGKLWWQAGCGSLVILALIGLVNLLVDPFDLRFAPNLSLPRMEAMRPINTALWSLGEFRQIPQKEKETATMIILGDSLAQQLTGGVTRNRSQTMGDDVRVINLSIGGASYEEMMDTLRYELPEFPSLKTVVLGVPLERLGEMGHQRTTEVYEIPSRPWKYLLNLKILSYSIGLLYNSTPPKDSPAATDEEIDTTPANSGEASAQNDVLWGSAGAVTIEKAFAKRIRLVKAPLALQRVRNELTPLAMQLRQRHIQLFFFIPPLNPYIKGVFEQTQGAADVKYLDELSKIGVVLDYAMNQPANITYRFRDPAHLDADVAHQVMLDLLQRVQTQPAAPAANSAP